MKLLILICSDRVIPHNIKIMDEGILKTWSSRTYKNIKILPYYGGFKESKLAETHIEVTAPDIGYETLYDKTLEAFKIAYNDIDFDIMLRTNISTYIRPDYLYSILKHYELNDFFGSTWYHPLDEKCYFSGITMLFSKDVIKQIIDSRVKNVNGQPDDVLLGKIIMKLYPNYNDMYKSFKRLDIKENSLETLNDPLFKIKYSNIWAFRCKTESNGVENRNLDIEKMKLLDKFFYNE